MMDYGNIFPAFRNIGAGESVIDYVDEDTYRARMTRELGSTMQASNLKIYLDENIRRIKLEIDANQNRLRDK